jgi:type IV fimbrial biogenesis protein FimT
MRERMQGFTLVELLVVMAIMGILLSLGVPAFTSYLANTRLRVAAESFLTGIQTARAEAIRLNSNVEFLLTNSVPLPDDGSDANFPVLQDPSQTGRFAANKIMWNANGYNWLVRTLPPTLVCDQNAGSDAAKACWFITGKSGAEGGGRNDSGSSTSIVIDSSMGQPFIRFTPFGGTSLAATAVYKFTNPSAGACVSNNVGAVRCLSVFVTAGGRARLCDPGLTAAQIANGDTRAC